MLAAWPEDLPSDAQIRKWLTNREFNEAYIPPLIKDFKATYGFAGLGGRGAGIRPDESPAEPTRESATGGLTPRPATAFSDTELSVMDVATTQTAPLANQISLRIPLSRTRFATLIAPTDISELEYDRIKIYLDHNRDAILETME